MSNKETESTGRRVAQSFKQHCRHVASLWKRKDAWAILAVIWMAMYVANFWQWRVAMYLTIAVVVWAVYLTAAYSAGRCLMSGYTTLSGWIRGGLESTDDENGGGD